MQHVKNFIKNLKGYCGWLSARGVAIFLIQGYQQLFSPDHGIFFLMFGASRCRFYPSCSEYALESIRQYGLLMGSMASFKRILRCNPWNEGGHDPFKSK